MDTKKVGSFSLSDGIQDEFAKSGNYLGIYIYASGTNADTETGTAEDIGRFLVERDEDQKDNIDYATLQDIMNTRSGISMLDSEEGGDFEAMAFIPFFPEGFPSCVNVPDDEHLNIEWQPDNGASDIFDSLDIEIYGRTASFAERGMLRINSKTETYTGEKSADDINLSKENITSVFIYDDDEVLSLFQFMQSGSTVQSPVPYGVLRGITLQENEIEDAEENIAKLLCTTPGDQDTLYNSDSVATVSVSGAGEIELVYCSWEPS